MSKGRTATVSEAEGAEVSERRGERAAAGAPMLTAVPDPEVPAKARRRRFTVAYKLRILRETESQHTPGAIGAVLRREGLYSTHLSAWRRERDRGALDSLSRRRRGRQPDPIPGARQRIATLEAENVRLQERLRQAEAIISAQKKLAEILGLPPGPVTQRESA